MKCVKTPLQPKRTKPQGSADRRPPWAASASADCCGDPTRTPDSLRDTEDTASALQPRSSHRDTEHFLGDSSCECWNMLTLDFWFISSEEVRAQLGGVISPGEWLVCPALSDDSAGPGLLWVSPPSQPFQGLEFS